jgi:hypothetical protein
LGESWPKVQAFKFTKNSMFVKEGESYEKEIQDTLTITIKKGNLNFTNIIYVKYFTKESRNAECVNNVCKCPEDFEVKESYCERKLKTNKVCMMYEGSFIIMPCESRYETMEVTKDPVSISGVIEIRSDADPHLFLKKITLGSLNFGPSRVYFIIFGGFIFFLFLFNFLFIAMPTFILAIYLICKKEHLSSERFTQMMEMEDENVDPDDEDNILNEENIQK